MGEGYSGPKLGDVHSNSGKFLKLICSLTQSKEKRDACVHTQPPRPLTWPKEVTWGLLIWLDARDDAALVPTIASLPLAGLRSLWWKCWDAEKHHHDLKRSFCPCRPQPSRWERTALTIHTEYGSYSAISSGPSWNQGEVLAWKVPDLAFVFKRNRI